MEAYLTPDHALSAAALIVLAYLVVLYIKTSNALVALDHRCDTAFADIDAHLRHRHDLIPGLVEVTKGVAEHEFDLILGIATTHAEAMNAVLPNLRLQAEGDLTAQIGSLLSAAEKYPELRALPEFARLREQFVACEDRITAARRFYNLAVAEYNTVLGQFPGNVVAALARREGRRPYDLGSGRATAEEPAAIAF